MANLGFIPQVKNAITLIAWQIAVCFNIHKIRTRHQRILGHLDLPDFSEDIYKSNRYPNMLAKNICTFR